jgi:hypothetical protein
MQGRSMTFIGDSLTRRLAVSWGMYTAINTSAPHAAQAISTIDLSSANLLVLLSGHNHTADCDPGGHAPLCCDHISFELVSTDKCVAHGGGVRGGRVEQGASWLTAVNAQGAHLFGRSPFNSLRVEWAPKLADWWHLLACPRDGWAWLRERDALFLSFGIHYARDYSLGAKSSPEVEQGFKQLAAGSVPHSRVRKGQERTAQLLLLRRTPCAVY